MRRLRSLGRRARPFMPPALEVIGMVGVVLALALVFPLWVPLLVSGLVAIGAGFALSKLEGPR